MQNKGFWSNPEGLKCVVLCGGEGVRFLPLSLTRQKGMIEIKNKPVLGYVIDFWKKFTNDFIFVVKFKKEGIIDFVKKLSINSQFVEPKTLGGIADGLSYTNDFIVDNFIVVLGDCICKGKFDFKEDMIQGVGVWKTSNIEDIKRSYSIKIKDNLVCRVEEKPKNISNDLCGMGFYFFNKRVFDYIKLTKPSKLRNEVEITDVIQNMIDSGEKISPLFFDGNYINITYTDDLQRAEKFL